MHHIKSGLYKISHFYHIFSPVWQYTRYDLRVVLNL
uniref:Uncharacterized protein n=1 Tax=Anguilla anguilla TaxID=7936 RepID=A0A0E9V2U0_ANGAN